MPSGRLSGCAALNAAYFLVPVGLLNVSQRCAHTSFGFPAQVSRRLLRWPARPSQVTSRTRRWWGGRSHAANALEL